MKKTTRQEFPIFITLARNTVLVAIHGIYGYKAQLKIRLWKVSLKNIWPDLFVQIKMSVIFSWELLCFDLFTADLHEESRWYTMRIFYIIFFSHHIVRENSRDIMLRHKNFLSLADNLCHQRLPLSTRIYQGIYHHGLSDAAVK